MSKDPAAKDAQASLAGARRHTLPMIDAFAAFRCSCYDIPTASPPQALSPGDVALAHGPAWPDPSPLCAQTPRTAPCDAFPRRYVDPRVHGHPPPFPARRLESRWASDPGADGQREVSRAQGGKISPSIMLPPGSYHHFHLFDPSCPTPPPACKSSCPACVTFGVCSSPRSHS